MNRRIVLTVELTPEQYQAWRSEDPARELTLYVRAVTARGPSPLPHRIATTADLAAAAAQPVGF